MADNSNDRLIQTIGMMGAEPARDGDTTAITAFHAATRMLKSRGMTWRDLAERAVGAGLAAQPLDNPGVARAQGFSDIFDEMFAGFSRPGGFGSAQPKARAPKPPSRLHGVDVPQSIRGIVRMLDADRKARTGPMLVLEIVGSETIYGPLFCFSASVQEELRKSIDQGLEVIARIQPPRAEGHSPVVVSANVIGD